MRVPTLKGRRAARERSPSWASGTGQAGNGAPRNATLRRPAAPVAVMVDGQGHRAATEPVNQLGLARGNRFPEHHRQGHKGIRDTLKDTPERFIRKSISAASAAPQGHGPAFHVQIENVALSTYCPDGIGRWFYERATGSYNTMLAREGTTPAQLRGAIPTGRKITTTDLAKFLQRLGTETRRGKLRRRPRSM